MTSMLRRAAPTASLGKKRLSVRRVDDFHALFDDAAPPLSATVKQAYIEA